MYMLFTIGTIRHLFLISFNNIMLKLNIHTFVIVLYLFFISLSFTKDFEQSNTKTGMNSIYTNTGMNSITQTME